MLTRIGTGHARSLQLKNPVMTASGTFGYGLEFEPFYDIQKLGAIVCKGTTLTPRPGNPQPRLAETASGMLNSIGLQNVGVDALIREKAPVWAAWQAPVIVNIAANSVDDYAAIAAKLDAVKGVSGLELNISCPNVKAGGMEFGTSPEAAATVTAAVRRATTLPLIVKLTPNVTDIVSIAVAVAGAGADAICLINTLRGMAIDTRRRKPLLGNICGGLSGPAIRPVAVYCVYQVFQAVSLPLIGCGGIANADDAVEFLMAGATAVEVGTANLVNPTAALDVLEGLEQYLRRENIADIKEIIGAAHSTD